MAVFTPKQAARAAVLSFVWSIATASSAAEPAPTPSERIPPALLFVALDVTSIEKSVDFYTRVVGLKAAERYGAESTTAPLEVVMRSGDSMQGAFILLTQRREPAGNGDMQAKKLDGLDRVAFTVPALSTVVQRAEANGVTLKLEPKPVPEAGVVVAMFDDPDGHTLEFIEFVKR